MYVGIDEAKTLLPKLIERVQKGEPITITKHSKPVAELAPVRRHDPQAVQQALRRLRAFRENLAACESATILDWAGAIFDWEDIPDNVIKFTTFVSSSTRPLGYSCSCLSQRCCFGHLSRCLFVLDTNHNSGCDLFDYWLGELPQFPDQPGPNWAALHHSAYISEISRLSSADSAGFSTSRRLPSLSLLMVRI